MGSRKTKRLEKIVSQISVPPLAEHPSHGIIRSLMISKRRRCRPLSHSASVNFCYKNLISNRGGYEDYDTYMVIPPPGIYIERFDVKIDQR
jgi:hypothetical protein